MSRLFVSDLDGTLVGKSGRMSAWSHRNLCRMLEQGLLFTVATARSIESVIPILESLPLRLPVLELNGALTTHLSNRHSAGCEALPSPVACSIAHHVCQLGLAPFLTTYDAPHQRLYPPADLSNEGMRWFFDERTRAGDSRLMPAGRTDEALQQPVVCLTVIARKVPLLNLRRWLQAHHADTVQVSVYVNPHQPHWPWLTVQSPRANKAHAIARLAGSLQLNWSDVTVFGDEDNDLAMFRAAGCAVAVDNAIASVKAAAHRVIGQQSTDSVVRYLLDHGSSATPFLQRG